MNGARGEVSLVVDGQARRLCLTLGALAEIETALGCAHMGELEVRLKRLSARDLSVVLGALLRGGGETQVAAGLATAQVDLAAAAKAVGQAFAAALA